MIRTIARMLMTLLIVGSIYVLTQYYGFAGFSFFVVALLIQPFIQDILEMFFTPDGKFDNNWYKNILTYYKLKRIEDARKVEAEQKVDKREKEIS